MGETRKRLEAVEQHPHPGSNSSGGFSTGELLLGGFEKESRAATMIETTKSHLKRALVVPKDVWAPRRPRGELILVRLQSREDAMTFLRWMQ
eukprot:10927545-Prorocentrum_lima.AAC.1